jgi:hypothetical protein
MRADITIVCCIPLCEGDWMERFSQPSLGDFVKSNSAVRFDGDPHASWKIFADEAEFIQQRLKSLAQAGVPVLLKAGRAAIRDAARTADNVVVIAHWKHVEIFDFDILSPTLLLDYVLTRDPGLEARLLHLPPATDDAARRKCIAAVLNEVVKDGESTLVDVPAALDTGSLPITILRRDTLNDAPGMLPANRLETWDAMISAEEFSALFDGESLHTVMLGICFSALIAETFRRRHRETLCIANLNPASAGVNIMRLSAAITLMRAKRIALWDALLRVSSMIDKLTKNGRLK